MNGKELTGSRLISNVELNPSGVPVRSFKYLIYNTAQSLNNLKKGRDTQGKRIDPKFVEERITYGVSNLKWLLAQSELGQKQIPEATIQAANQTIEAYQSRAQAYLDQVSSS